MPSTGTLNVEVEETEYGYVSKIQAVGARRFRENHTHNVMPNIRMRRSSGGGNISGWQEAIRWSVPVDDGHFLNLSVSKTHVTGAERVEFEERQRTLREQVRGLSSSIEIAEGVLAGDMGQFDFPDRLGVFDPRMFNICDYVTQVGQGPFGLLNPSHLGRGDVEPIMLRRLYTRELAALRDGRPLKQWRIPDHIVVRVTED
jgi:hypothetical protein